MIEEKEKAIERLDNYDYNCTCDLDTFKECGSAERCLMYEAVKIAIECIKESIENEKFNERTKGRDNTKDWNE